MSERGAKRGRPKGVLEDERQSRESSDPRAQGTASATRGNGWQTTRLRSHSLQHTHPTTRYTNPTRPKATRGTVGKRLCIGFHPPHRSHLSTFTHPHLHPHLYRCAQGRSRSMVSLAASTVSSSYCRPIIWAAANPPFSVRPAGTDAAG